MNIFKNNNNNNNLNNRRFLVPYDGSNESQAGFRYALNNTNPTDEILLYHAKYKGIYLPNLTLDNDIEAKALMDCSNNNRSCRWIKSDAPKPFKSDICKEICSAADKEGVSNVIIGTAKEQSTAAFTDSNQFYSGSVASGVVMRCNCPVIVVKKNYSTD